MLKSANIILLMINHINKKIDINPMQRSKAQLSYLKQDESLPGGNTIIYLTNLLLRFDDNTKLKEDEAFGIPGNLVDITLVKSRNNRAGKSCTMVFNQAEGFDADLSLFLELKNAKRVNGAGAYLYFGDRSDLKFAQKNFKEKLNTDEEFREVFINEALKYLKEDLDQYDIEDEQQVQSEFNVSRSILNKLNPCLSN